MSHTPRHFPVWPVWNTPFDGNPVWPQDGESMKNIYAFDYDSSPTQPREGKAMSRISDNEIRLIVLESKEFAYAAGEKLRDELTNEQAALLAYYMLAGGLGEKFLAYAIGVLQPILKKALDSEIEDYKYKHDLNEEPDDCSAFKEHRELNPEDYE